LKTLYGWRVATDADGIHHLVPPDDEDGSERAPP